MGLWDVVSRQLSEPSGLGGRVIAGLMNRGNRAMNERALELLELREGKRVLEVGFGGGLVLDELLARGALVTGLDRAGDMVAAARRGRQGPLGEGRLTLLRGDVHSVPAPDASYDRILTVNTVYFWPELEVALAELGRVLAPEGRMVVGIRDPSAMRKVSRDVFTLRSPESVRDAVEVAGFADVRLESKPGSKCHFVIASDRPPAAVASVASSAT